MMSILEKLRSRGYWEVIIRPAEYLEKRISNLQECKAIIRESQVSLRGWSFPFVGTQEPPTNGIDYIEQLVDWDGIIELMRFYQSGQFVHFSALSEDWQSESRLFRFDAKPGQYLVVINTLYRITEIYEFASRLASKGILGGECIITANLHGNKGRSLTTLDPRRHLYHHYQSAIESLPYAKTLPTAELITRSAELALDHAIWVFERYNWDNPPRSVLHEDQKRLLEQRL